MVKFKVVRTWYVEAESIADAVEKTRNFDHVHVAINRLSDRIVTYHCDCNGPHRPDCFLGRRLKIKYNEILTEDYLKDPESWESWIDKKMEKRYGQGEL